MCHHFTSHHLLTTDSRHAIVSIEKGAADRRSALSIQSYRMTAHLGLGAVISACYHFFLCGFRHRYSRDYLYKFDSRWKAITEPASISPDKIGFQLLTIVDQQVLARHAVVDAGQVVTEVCNFFCGSPFVQECLIQALPHEVGIINDMGIEGSQYPARGNTVAGRSVFCDAQCDILHIGQDTALAGGV